MEREEFQKKILNNYIKKKENQIESLKNKALNMNKNIEKEIDTMKKNKQVLEKLKQKKSMLLNQYNYLLNKVKYEGIFINIRNNNYSIKQWENLFIIKQNKEFIIVNKKGEHLDILQKELVGILYNELIEKRYSLMVMRISSRVIVARLIIKN
ncbi:hypothetical protein IRP63_03660 [Clostridium botulinum]|uniref:Uncharacterized protein n=2 Tax=Clostridium botulinum TaxID=1491 RepID=A0A0A0IHL5_CLOBO|nr:hypothetical protein [Clostridium botulinum]KEI00229.1 hypothetical protein Z952_01735 [Clostridium botulinum C/D str. BKT75002]KEI07008.1 hypothetical protein Z954_04760 [Clostridium botulinum C/D str. BKT2873]KGM94909.1 hypothetical protein Z956_06170 [Clostridium botulinum D str. CCUG 7971]KGM99060.1 hypothetical protein Z955_09585 [Clostridium botulinum C/D str. DC5]KOC47344.1 hypothetical protein ADU88_10135 [Clostridium botulinum]